MNRAYTTPSMRVSKARWVQWLVAVVATVSLTAPVWPVVATHVDQECHACCPERVGPAPVAAHDGALPQCCLVQAPATPPLDPSVAPRAAQTHLAPVATADVAPWAAFVDLTRGPIEDVSPPPPSTRALRTVVLLI